MIIQPQRSLSIDECLSFHCSKLISFFYAGCCGLYQEGIRSAVQSYMVSYFEWLSFGPSGRRAFGWRWALIAYEIRRLTVAGITLEHFYFPIGDTISNLSFTLLLMTLNKLLTLDCSYLFPLDTGMWLLEGISVVMSHMNRTSLSTFI